MIKDDVDEKGHQEPEGEPTETPPAPEPKPEAKPKKSKTGGEEIPAWAKRMQAQLDQLTGSSKPDSTTKPVEVTPPPKAETPTSSAGAGGPAKPAKTGKQKSRLVVRLPRLW